MTRLLLGQGVGVRWSWSRVIWLALLFALGTTPSSFAQAVYGSISGTVVDNSGGALPGVNVTVTSVERKTVDTVVTDESGRFLKEPDADRRRRGPPAPRPVRDSVPARAASSGKTSR